MGTRVSLLIRDFRLSAAWLGILLLFCVFFSAASPQASGLSTTGGSIVSEAVILNARNREATRINPSTATVISSLRVGFLSSSDNQTDVFPVAGVFDPVSNVTTALDVSYTFRKLDYTDWVRSTYDMYVGMGYNYTYEEICRWFSGRLDGQSCIDVRPSEGWLTVTSMSNLTGATLPGALAKIWTDPTAYNNIVGLSLGQDGAVYVSGGNSPPLTRVSPTGFQRSIYFAPLFYYDYLNKTGSTDVIWPGTVVWATAVDRYGSAWALFESTYMGERVIIGIVKLSGVEALWSTAPENVPIASLDYPNVRLTQLPAGLLQDYAVFSDVTTLDMVSYRPDASYAVPEFVDLALTSRGEAYVVDYKGGVVLKLPNSFGQFYENGSVRTGLRNPVPSTEPYDDLNKLPLLWRRQVEGHPVKVTVDAADHAWVGTESGDVTHFDEFGNPVSSFRLPLVPSSMEFDLDGRLWVLDSKAKKVAVLEGVPSGGATLKWVALAEDTPLNLPTVHPLFSMRSPNGISTGLMHARNVRNQFVTHVLPPPSGPIVILSDNKEPIANAGPDQEIILSQSVQVVLDGSLSSDPDGDVLTFAWELIPPTGSAVNLSASSTSRTSFTPDIQGVYTAILRVHDGKTSVSDSVQIRVMDVTNPVLFVETLTLDAAQELRTALDGLTGATATAVGAAIKKFDQIAASAGDITDIMDKLEAVTAQLSKANTPETRRILEEVWQEALHMVQLMVSACTARDALYLDAQNLISQAIASHDAGKTKDAMGTLSDAAALLQGLLAAL